jgi:hypothetical protein
VRIAVAQVGAEAEVSQHRLQRRRSATRTTRVMARTS